jgi:3-deoxy-D-manno-octulosonic-acid transferase
MYTYQLIIRLVSCFNPKAKLWVKGRKNWQAKLKSAIGNHNKVIWFHAASLGEFEQGRPLIEKIKSEHDDVFVLLTFYSPSGYELRKNYDKADYVCYLPADTKSNAKQFLEIVKPSQAYFIKYEFWFNYIQKLGQLNVPLYLVSGIFAEHQVFFKSYSKWFVKQLAAFTHFFVQNEHSVSLLKKLGFDNVTKAGDTRFDRVIEIAEEAVADALVKTFVGDKKCIVVGSSWPKDEALLLPFINKNTDYKYIIAPHEIHESHINEIASGLNVQYQIWTKADNSKLADAQVLIVDTIGQLASLYQFANLAYVGGAFGSGLHNILEPAVYGIPVVFGPKYQKFQEAKDLLNKEAVVSINDAENLHEVLNNWLEKDQERLKMGQKAKDFIYQSQGAVNIIFENTLSKNL